MSAITGGRRTDATGTGATVTAARRGATVGARKVCSCKRIKKSSVVEEPWGSKSIDDTYIRSASLQTAPTWSLRGSSDRSSSSGDR